jgi:protein CpxP
MKTGKKFTTALIVVLLLLNVGLVATIWMGDCNGSGHPHDGPPHRAGNLFESELGWDAAQADAFKTLRDEHHSSMQSIHEDLGKLKQQMLDLVTHDTDAGLEEAITKISAKHTEMDRITFAHFRAVREICTPEQVSAFDTLWKDVKGKLMPGPKGPHGPPPHGK